MTHPNEPISPVKVAGELFTDVHLGLTKREYFAAMAMQALIPSHREVELDDAVKFEYEGCAMNAVEFADALIAELSK